MATTVATARPRSSGLPGGRLYDAADALVWIAGLNLLIVALSLLGAVVVGLAPALVAAVTVSRARLRGDQQPLLRTFAAVWRRELLRANLLMLPFAAVAALLALNLSAFAPVGGALVVVLWVALGVVALAATFALTLYAHYELPLHRYPLVALAFIGRNVPAALLVVVVTSIAVLVTRFLPGLLPVLTIGAWTYVVSALCLSFYARNDRLVAASTTTE